MQIFLNYLTIVWPNSRAWCAFSLHVPLYMLQLCSVVFHVDACRKCPSLTPPFGMWLSGSHSLTFCWVWNLPRHKWRSWVLSSSSRYLTRHVAFPGSWPRRMYVDSVSCSAKMELLSPEMRRRPHSWLLSSSRRSKGATPCSVKASLLVPKWLLACPYRKCHQLY